MICEASFFFPSKSEPCDAFTVTGQPNFPPRQWDLREREAAAPHSPQLAVRLEGCETFLLAQTYSSGGGRKEMGARLLSSCPLLVCGGRY